MTWLVLRYWYGYHRARFHKWEARKDRWDEKKGWKMRVNRAKRQRRIYRKRDHHAWWLNHYCDLIDAYGHKIDCIHFGEGENTIQHHSCPYQEDWCKHCPGKIYLGQGIWQHYLSAHRDHTPEPKLAHWPHTIGKTKITTGEN